MRRTKAAGAGATVNGLLGWRRQGSLLRREFVVPDRPWALAFVDAVRQRVGPLSAARIGTEIDGDRACVTVQPTDLSSLRDSITQGDAALLGQIDAAARWLDLPAVASPDGLP